MSHTPRPILPLIEQHRELVERHMQRYVVEPSGCWRWTGPSKAGSHGDAYGTVSLSKRIKLRANRLSIGYHRGIEPGSLLVLHTCDNSMCVCPDHLTLGTHRDNVLDMLERGRAPSYLAKLNGQDVEKIARLLDEATDEEIVDRLSLDVTPTTILSIRSGKTWSRLTGIRPEPSRAA